MGVFFSSNSMLEFSASGCSFAQILRGVKWVVHKLNDLFNVNLGAIIDNNSWWDTATMGWNVASAAGEHITEGDVDPETRDAILAGTYSNGIVPHLLGVHAGDTLKIGSMIGFERMNQEDTLSYFQNLADKKV